MTERSPQDTAREIEGYLKDNQLYYGSEPRNNGDASWTLALNNHTVTPEQESSLQTSFPEFIDTFHRGSARLMHSALTAGNTSNPPLDRLRRYLTMGVPEETQELWQQAARNGQEVFSSRPDMIVDPQGKFHIVEYNTDGVADKGNTQGINDYSRMFLGKETLGANLAKTFVNSIRQKYNDRDTVTVATVLPDNYRQEYDAQNRYFANQAQRYGSELGVRWITMRVSDVHIDDSKVYAVLDGNKHTLDVLDREFKLPGFMPEVNFEREVELVRAALEGRVEMLGSILPFQDKVLLSTLFDKDYSSAYDEDNLPAVRQVHAETAIVNRDQPNIQLGGNALTLDDIYGLRPDFSMVLKRGGDTVGSTGSKGLVISEDVSPDAWKKELDRALTEPLSGGNFWVVQRFYQSKRFPVRHIRNSRSQYKELQVINRFAPYYVRGQEGFRLGNILVTAGTDEETYKRHKNNVHGLRQNTYQAVSLNGKNNT